MSAPTPPALTTICPKCLSDQVITVRIDDGETISCGGCSEEYSLTDVAALVESWGRLLPWLLTHPARQNTPVLALAATG